MMICILSEQQLRLLFVTTSLPDHNVITQSAAIDLHSTKHMHTVAAVNALTFCVVQA